MNPERLQLGAPWFLLLFLLIPLLYLLSGALGPENAVRFSSLHLIRKLGQKVRGKPFGMRSSLFFLSLAFGILALSRPQFLSTYEIARSNGIELFVVMDVSRSMAIEDFFIGKKKVTRLEAAKNVTREFINGRPGDRIGAIAFAGLPYLAGPLTMDHRWLMNRLDQIEIGLVEDGTAIGSALAMTANRLDQRPAQSKIIVLLTDGANNVGELTPKDAARLASSLGIRIHTIAVGTSGVHPIPMPGGQEIHRQEFDVETLKAISEIADGEFFRAEDTEGLSRIFRAIDAMEVSEFQSFNVVDVRETFPYLIALALGLGFVSLWRDDIMAPVKP